MHGLTTYYVWEGLDLNLLHVADGEGGLKLTVIIFYYNCFKLNKDCRGQDSNT